METKLLDFINRHELVRKGDRILAGLSGGPDSICLVNLLASLAKTQGWELGIAHLNHHLRGEQSNLEMEFARDTALKIGVRFHVRDMDIHRIAKRNNEGIEVCARLERYYFFRDMAERHSYNKIVLAHNANDHIETILFRILRGTGLRGLVGIPTRRPVARGSNIEVIRPLIEISREEIVDYLKQNSLQYFLDVSNFMSFSDRNRLRHYLLPLLEKEFNPNIREALKNLSAIAAEGYEIVTHAFNAEDFLSLQQDEDEMIFSFLVEEGRKFSHFQSTLLLETGIELLTGEFSPVNRDVILQLEQLMAGGIGASGFDIPGGLGVWLEYESVVVGRRAKPKKPAPAKMPLPGCEVFPEYNLAMDIQETAFVPGEFEKFKNEKTDNEEWFDADLFSSDLNIRYWQQGDSFQPLGLEGSKKLQDFFVDEKIPKRLRSRIPLLLSGDQISWVIGLRSAHPFRVTNGTKRVYKIKVT
ncbi:tRNA lysidine(34) synthetase TilS [Planctomycetota bacterium]